MSDAVLCARFHKAIELIGRRWSGAIVQMLLRRPARFVELRSAIPDITDRMLSERLQELEEEGLVVRKVVPEIPVRVEYQLSPKGRALEPALTAVGSWAQHWIKELPGTGARPANDVRSPRRRARLAARAGAFPRASRTSRR